MCGISGIFSSRQVDGAAIQLMVNELTHRGPDFRGVFLSSDGMTALGHNRLSVIDLSSKANQPMLSPDKRYAIVFNGEIYNFQKIRNQLHSINSTIQFRTSSDTETILYAYAQWGRDMVYHLDGMFAMAIYDQLKNTLFVCRDRVGKKPLFYFTDDKHFIFASEIKSLLRHPVLKNRRKVNLRALNYFLHLGYIPEPYTIFNAINKFPAGSWACVDSPSNVKPQSFWKIEQHLVKEKTSHVGHSKDELRDILYRSVEKRLISDVPLGAFLSGGTDSSLIAAIASQQLATPLKTFTIGFSENKFDESDFANAVAKHLQTDHHEYILSEKKAVDLLETYMSHFDEPFADTSAIPTMLVSQWAGKEVTVALTGDGGDELFQGYGAYIWANRLGSRPWRVVGPFLRVLLASTRSSRFNRVARLLGDQYGNPFSHIFSQENYFFAQKEIYERLLLDEDFFEPFEYNANPMAGFDLTKGEQQALFDFKYYLKDDLLVKVDRASMYYSLECRCPFLDKELIAFACSLDVTLKNRHGVSKWLLKELLSDYLPGDLVYRTKRGFSIPLSKWLKNDLRYLMDEFLSKEATERVGLFKIEYINRLKKDFLDGKDFLYNRLWTIIVIHKWMKDNL